MKHTDRHSFNESQADITQLQAFLKKEPGVELAIVYGSLASGNFTSESDVDLAIQKSEPLSKKQRMYIIEQTALITGRAVDLVDLSSVGEPLLGQILKYGKRLLGSDVHFAELGLKHVYAQADFVPYIERTLKERRDKWLNT
ncbi:DNA polymerase, beta-like region [hydrothermal vent metagenome]|uniref:DNA polymerase, beta-like region n=1 Tax=hydrothermal vent metagenome TaxID=652676 RepID=A0A3B0XK21_9ZZZZ